LNLKTKAIFIGAILSALIVGLAIGSILYSLTIPMSVTTQSSYELVLKTWNPENPIISYDWPGVMCKGDSAKLEVITSQFLLRLYNYGEKAENCTWSCTLPLGFILTINTDSGNWTEGAWIVIDAEASLKLNYILLENADAIPDQTFNFDLLFLVVD